jgi:site-specific DNA-methyltransferase (adenine-specific)
MSVRVEHIGDATLYLGDCQELLPRFDGDVAVVADPPYGIWFRHSGCGNQFPVDRGGRKSRVPRFAKISIVGDKEGCDPGPMLRFEEVIIWGANHFADQLPASSRWLVWDKRDGMASNTFSDCELAWCKKPGAARLIHYLWNGICRAGEKESRVHPMQKPIEVMAWSIGFTAGDTICDPFMGSGTTGVAALRLGRKFIGIEIDERWFDIACRRIEAEARQGRLDIPEIAQRPPPREDPVPPLLAAMEGDGE